MNKDTTTVANMRDKLMGLKVFHLPSRTNQIHLELLHDLAGSLSHPRDANSLLSLLLALAWSGCQSLPPT